jgi:hypothetical protein
MSREVPTTRYFAVGFFTAEQLEEKHRAMLARAAQGSSVPQIQPAVGALAELQSTLITQSRRAIAPAGGLISDEIINKGWGGQRSTYPVMGPSKVSVGYAPTGYLRSSWPPSYTRRLA